MEFIEIRRDGPVSIHVLKHEKQNRFNSPFMEEILDSMTQAAADDSVRAVVFTSENEKYFTSGLYLEWMMTTAATDPDGFRGFLTFLQRMLVETTSFPKPLVGAINGHVVGAGFIWAACMDYRLMIEDKGFCRLPEAQIGIPFWPGMMAILKDILPPAALRDYVYTADPFTSSQSKELGFVDELCPADQLLPRAVELARKLGTSQLPTYKDIKIEMRRNTLDVMKNLDPKTVDEVFETMQAARA